MELIETPEEYGEEIKRCISKFGYAAEHNYDYLLSVSEDAKNIFFKRSDGYGILAAYDENSGTVTMYTEAFAPREKQVEVLGEALELCFEKLGIKKMIIQQDEALRQETLKMLKGNGYRPLRPMYSFYWPIFNMERWNGNEMKGEEWKKLRNIRNRFYTEHSVEVVDSAAFDKEALKKIVTDWIYHRGLVGRGVHRQNSNKVYYKQYLRIIDRGLEHLTYAKTLVVDELPRTIMAGWEIPNSNRAYYSGIGICDYSIEGLGEAANLEDLRLLKENGYRSVEFGGSTLPLLKFKLKFRPHAVYVTHTYAIIKK